MTNILADNDFILDDFNPVAIARGIGKRMRERRLELNLTQKGLAEKAGVSLGSLKRFENTGEISLKHLLMIAVVLNSTEEFGMLFSKTHYQSIEEAMKLTATKKRKRGRFHD
jgi:transcriptional regulator with XRE-family HTH domain